MFYLVCCRRDLTVSTGNSRCKPRSGFPKRISPLNAISFENPVKKKETSRTVALTVVGPEVTVGLEWLLLLPPSRSVAPPPEFQPRGTWTVRFFTASDRILQTSEEFVVLRRIRMQCSVWMEASRSAYKRNITLNSVLQHNDSITQGIFVGYSESKYRLRVSLAHPRDCHFAHVQWLPLSIEKPQTPFRDIRVMFMFVPVR